MAAMSYGKIFSKGRPLLNARNRSALATPPSDLQRMNTRKMSEINAEDLEVFGNHDKMYTKEFYLIEKEIEDLRACFDELKDKNGLISVIQLYETMRSQ